MPSNSAAGTGYPMDLALGAARQGAADAREAAGRFADSAGVFVSRFVYTTCYTVSYGVVFPTVMLARSLPRHNPFAPGFLDGAAAATRRVDEFLGASSSDHILSLPQADAGSTSI